MSRRDIKTMAFEDMSYFHADGCSMFENISIELPKAPAVWVRSPGGRGKTTLLRILSGLLSPTGGRYLINGKDVAKMSFEDFLPYRLAMGYGFDLGGLLNNKTLYENLVLPLLYHKMVPPDEANERVSHMVDFFGISNNKDLRPFSVSGSQRKLTCTIRAFVHQPQIVFLDDPLTGLKEDNLNDLLSFVDESYANGWLRQIFFTAENPILAQRLKAEELLISCDWFTTRMAA